ncbi:MAG: molybdopterin-dependent oxidoreductase, partial [Candidatus Caldarchaeum sp.]|nr:molybdopterin-dependent oxidoreductase [Candidatus Caldarchaeum sp.]MDW8436092.1 molybdopterin cofactor-binding domain-containing protein [Candidatus Caldarchaeum sp.]
VRLETVKNRRENHEPLKLSKRVEDPRFLRGEAVYVDDLFFPKMLHLVFVRSPYAHAKIKSIANSPTHQKAFVFDGKTVASRTKPLYTLVKNLSYYGIAVEKACFFGEPVAMVLAETREEALDASEEVAVEYEPLPAVVEPEEAVNSNVIHESVGTNVVVEKTFQFGDVNKAFDEAYEVVSEKFVFQRYAAAPLETCGVVAVPEKDGSLTVYDNQQTPLLFRRFVADSLGLAAEKLRFVEKDVGGGFGVKIMMYPYVFLTCFAALSLKRPVKWVETRREHLAAMAHNSNRVTTAEMAFTRDGRITAYRTKFIEDVGDRAVKVAEVIRSNSTSADSGGSLSTRLHEAALPLVETQKMAFEAFMSYDSNLANSVITKVTEVMQRITDLQASEEAAALRPHQLITSELLRVCDDQIDIADIAAPFPRS